MSQSHSQIEIPQRFKDCIAELAMVCEKHKIGFIKGTIKPAFGDPWVDNFDFDWIEAGHGGRGGVRISTTVRDCIEVPMPTDKLSQPANTQ